MFVIACKVTKSDQAVRALQSVQETHAFFAVLRQVWGQDEVRIDDVVVAVSVAVEPITLAIFCLIGVEEDRRRKSRRKRRGFLVGHSQSLERCS